MSNVRIISWDWRGQPDIEELNEAVSAVFDGIHCPQVTSVDTGGDEYAVLVSPAPMTSAEAQAAYEEHWEEETA